MDPFLAIKGSKKDPAWPSWNSQVWFYVLSPLAILFFICPPMNLKSNNKWRCTHVILMKLSRTAKTIKLLMCRNPLSVWVEEIYVYFKCNVVEKK
jgi:hypothetical protein